MAAAGFLAAGQMTPGRLLPFERRFREWIDARGMGWTRTSFCFEPGGPETVAYRFTPSSPAKRILLAAHGAGNDALFAWTALFKRQLEAGTEVFTFDLPGHGRDNRTLFNARGATAALRAAVQEAARRARPLPVHAIGVSLGGSLLLGALPQLYTQLTSVTLIVAPLRIELSPRSLLGELRLANFRLLARERAEYGWTGLVPSFGPFKRDIYPLRLETPPPKGVFGYVSSLNDALAELQLESAAQETPLPVQLIYGALDRIVPAEQGERLRRAFPSAELDVLPSGSHLSTPLLPQTLDLVDRWLDRW